MIHELKTWPAPFGRTAAGAKPYELRKADRDYQVGDTLHLREWDEDSEKTIDGRRSRYTGAEAWLLVVHITMPGQWGIPLGMCVMGVELLRTVAPGYVAPAERLEPDCGGRVVGVPIRFTEQELCRIRERGRCVPRNVHDASIEEKISAAAERASDDAPPGSARSMEHDLERAYWEYDNARKGRGAMTGRDAFKCVVRSLLASAAAGAQSDPGGGRR